MSFRHECIFQGRKAFTSCAIVHWRPSLMHPKVQNLAEPEPFWWGALQSRQRIGHLNLLLLLLLFRNLLCFFLILHLTKLTVLGCFIIRVVIVAEQKKCSLREAQGHNLINNFVVTALQKLFCQDLLLYSQVPRPAFLRSPSRPTILLKKSFSKRCSQMTLICTWILFTCICENHFGLNMHIFGLAWEGSKKLRILLINMIDGK